MTLCPAPSSPGLDGQSGCGGLRPQGTPLPAPGTAGGAAGFSPQRPHSSAPLPSPVADRPPTFVPRSPNSQQAGDWGPPSNRRAASVFDDSDGDKRGSYRRLPPHELLLGSDELTECMNSGVCLPNAGCGSNWSAFTLEGEMGIAFAPAPPRAPQISVRCLRRRWSEQQTPRLFSPESPCDVVCHFTDKEQPVCPGGRSSIGFPAAETSARPCQAPV